MAKFCPHCGTPIEAGDLYCVGCGAKLAPEEMNAEGGASAPFGAGDAGGAPKVPIATSNPTLQSLEEKFLTYEGRVNRKPYFIRCLILGILSWVGSKLWAMSLIPFGLIGAIVGIFCYVSSIMLEIRRIHDINQTGWFALLGLIPVVNVVFALVLLLFRGTDGPNRFGPDPLAGVQDK